MTDEDRREVKQLLIEALKVTVLAMRQERDDARTANRESTIHTKAQAADTALKEWADR